MYERDGVALIGRLTEDPVLRRTRGEAPKSVTGFGVACSADQFDDELAALLPVEGSTRFVRFTAWRGMAEHVVASFERGTRVIAVGRLEVKTFGRRDGLEELQVQLTVRDVGPSVMFAVARPVEPGEAAGREVQGR